MIKAEVFPKVFIANKRQTLYVQITEGELAQAAPTIKIQPMERYAIGHTPLYRIDEEERYPFLEMKKEGDGLYSIAYDFFDEQRYDVKVRCGGEEICCAHVYSVKQDLAEYGVFKGDTHLHTCRSDGEGTPFEVGCAYRAAGYDFIAVTDHHKYAPSLEAKAEFEKLTKVFTVFKGEEVHNRDMGYFHIINFDGDFSVNEIVETQDGYMQTEVSKLLENTDYPEDVADKYACAYRTFVAEQIRKGGGLAIMAHPYWECYGEYNAQASNVVYLLKNGCFDALEVLAGCDQTDHGNNLQLALWSELRAEGVKIPVVGASDSHSTTSSDSLFNKQYSLVFAKGADGIKEGIKAERSVAVLARKGGEFLAFGQFRYVKYARFLLEEYFPEYVKLTKKHARALAKKQEKAIAKAEKALTAYQKKFFAW